MILNSPIGTRGKDQMGIAFGKCSAGVEIHLLHLRRVPEETPIDTDDGNGGHECLPPFGAPTFDIGIFPSEPSFVKNSTDEDFIRDQNRAPQRKGDAATRVEDGSGKTHRRNRKNEPPTACPPLEK